MTATASAPTTFDLLNQCIQSLGVAVLPIWGVDEQGVCLCPLSKQCKAAGKHPHRLCPNGVKNATRDPNILRQWVRQASRANWAMRCGDPLPDGGFLGVFDWDPRNGSAESLAQIRARGDVLSETVSAASGGGGGHRAYRFKVAPASRCVAPGIDLQGAGKYVVIAPSKHRSGGVYTWDLGMGPGDLDVADAPDWLANGTGEALPRPASDGGTARETVLGEAFALAGRAGPVMPGGEMYVNCPQSHLHTDARGQGEDASTVILPPAGGSKFGGFSCRHGHCANLKWADVMKMLPKEVVSAANAKYPRLGVVPAPAEEDVDDAAAPDLTFNTPSEESPEMKECERTLRFRDVKGTYKIINDVLNVSIVLTYDPRWKGVLCYDEFAQVLRFVKPPPWHEDDAPKDKADVWQDSDVMRLHLWLQRNWSLEVMGDKLREIVYVVGRRNAVNPLTDYLNKVTWDGTPRLDAWLINYAGCADTTYTRVAGRKWILSAVARAYDNGCKVDTVLILEGPQGKGKSTVLKTLTPASRWFSDTAFDMNSKDAYVSLRGKFIIELAELASLNKADLDRAKAFFSSPVDNYRPPYGRENVDIPRTCVFAGTVNLGQYLNDSTGARRFWPVLCGVIDITSLETDRDQIWAEAVNIYKAWRERGSLRSECLWFPSAEENGMFETQQLERETDRPWTEAIAHWVKSEVAQVILRKRGYLTLREVGTGAVGLVDKDLTSTNTTNIGIILTRDLHWNKERKIVNGARIWGYAP